MKVVFPFAPKARVKSIRKVFMRRMCGRGNMQALAAKASEAAQASAAAKAPQASAAAQASAARHCTNVSPQKPNKC